MPLTLDYRPRTFTEVVGQTHIIPVLRAFVIKGNPPPALIFSGNFGSGKGQPLSSKVLTPTGWRLMGDLKVGDFVIGKSGNPVKVTGVFDRGVLPTYRVHFSDHTSLVVDGDHLWKIQTMKQWMRGNYQVQSTRTLFEYYNNLVACPASMKNVRIPLVDPVQYPEKSLPLDPYVLGALLANSVMHGNCCLVTNDEHIALEVARRLEGTGITLRETIPNPTRRWIVRGIRPTIASTGLKDVLSGKKFIPEEYFHASEQQRRDLLAGLLDCDGGVRYQENRGQAHYYTTSHALADGVVALVESLGGIVSKTFVSRVLPTGREYDDIDVAINLPENPFTLPRKKDLWKPSKKRTRIIKSIVEERPQPIRCISVDAEDSLYVTERHIVTHNTSAARIYAAALNCPNVDQGNPCGTCSVCSSIRKDSSDAVVEIDAASRSGVNDIRSLREMSLYAHSLEWRVIIIDEVQALSRDAFRALLKILEEPPERTTFLLLTTEPEDIPKPVQSRSVTFEFTTVPLVEVAKRLKAIADDIGFAVSPVLCARIAQVTSGHLRDAVMELDKCYQVGITQDEEYMSLSNRVDVSMQILASAAYNDTKNALAQVDAFFSHTSDYKRFLDQLSSAIVSVSRAYVGVPSPEGVVELAHLINKDSLTAAYSIIWDAYSKTNTSHNPKITAQLVVQNLVNNLAAYNPPEAEIAVKMPQETILSDDSPLSIEEAFALLE